MTRICFVGAGSVVFTTRLLRDLLSYDDLGELHIALHDIDADRLETARLTAEQVARRLGRPVGVSAHTDRRAALEGVDVAITMFQVGGLAATKIDFEVPARFGLRQTIGDTLGVGGVFRALRTFPVLRDIAADMAAVCPDAWLLNYTNPMAMNVWWLAEVAPALRSVGLCHSVYWTVDGLCDIIGVPVAEVDYRAAGVNHQAWLLQWQRNGEDLYPLLRERIAADEQLRRRVRVDLFQRLGYYPTETSEHSSEYVPFYLHHDEEIARLRIPVGDYVQISEDNVRQYEAARATLAAGVSSTSATREEVAEYAPQVIHSLVTGTQQTIHANVANRGLIDNLPSGRGWRCPRRSTALGSTRRRWGRCRPSARRSTGPSSMSPSSRSGPRSPRTAPWCARRSCSTRTPRRR